MQDKKILVRQLIRELTSDQRVSALILTEGQKDQSEGQKSVIDRGIDALAERMTADLSSQINFELQSAREPVESIKIIEQRLLKEVEKIKDANRQKEQYKAKPIDSGVPTWDSKPRFGEARRAAKSKRAAAEQRKAKPKTGLLKKAWTGFKRLFGE